MLHLQSDKQKLLFYGLGFTLFLSAILMFTQGIFAYFVSHSNTEQTGKINLVMQHQIDTELMIFGSSVAEVGFDTKVLEQDLNLSAYNMAIDGTPISGSEFLTNEFLDYTQNCKTIVIGMAFFSLGDLNLMNAPERYLAHKTNPHVKDNFKKISPSLYNKLYHVPFYSFIVANHTYYKNAFIGAKNSLKNIALDNDPLKGFVPHYSDYEDTRESLKNLEAISISKTTMETYTAIIEKIKAKGITPVLVITPMYIQGQQSFSNYNEYLTAVESLSEQTHTTFFDFSTHAIVNDENYFYNNGHLNASGALKFTEAVSDSLKIVIHGN